MEHLQILIIQMQKLIKQLYKLKELSKEAVSLNFT